jgi:hypothetical protein
MYTYTIYKDGYPIGQAKGLKHSVDRINLHIKEMGLDEGLWYYRAMDRAPSCQVQGMLFTIERTIN